MKNLIALGSAAAIAIAYVLWSTGVLQTIGNAIMTSFQGKIGL